MRNKKAKFLRKLTKILTKEDVKIFEEKGEDFFETKYKTGSPGQPRTRFLGMCFRDAYQQKKREFKLLKKKA